MGLVRRLVTEGVVCVLLKSSGLILNPKTILSYIMKLFLVVLFIASATSAPQHGSGRAVKSFADEFRAGLVNIPEGCSFISQSQETVNGVIKGGYTYVEKRKIVKAYGTDGASSNLLTAEEVVRQVSTELRPTIIQIIRTTVESANVDLNNYGNL